MVRIASLRPMLAAMAPSAGLRRLAPGLLALALGAELFVYLGPAAVDRRTAASTAALADRLEREGEPVRRRLNEMRATSSQEAARDADPRSFLKRMNEAASRHGARITRLAPRPHEAGLLDIEMVASFPALLRFATEVELLHGTFHGLRIRPAESGEAGQSVAFTLEIPRRPPVAEAQAARWRVAAADPLLHDPFAAGGEAGADLSQRYRLTAVTRIGRTAMATIDGRDYVAGDQLDGMSVVTVGAAEVSLAAGEQRYRLHFAARGE